MSQISRDSALLRHGLRLEYATLVWNLLEGTGAIAAGIAAHSVALTAYGLDSAVEVLASGVTVWHLRGTSERREKRALRIIGGCYLVVAVYIGAEATRHLVRGARPHGSPLGIALTAAAVAVMTILGMWKRSVGHALDNNVLIAEANFSLIDGALSGTVLLGLALYSALGWWWADAAAGIAVALLAAFEGVENLRDE
jgi:divalent metal cation (Fe/Co/Zn/Cd) transporter